MSFNIQLLVILLSAFLLGSCQPAKKPSNPFVEPVNLVECKQPRPEACTKEYRPVCAQKDTGVRCVTTPCPSTEDVTASNACVACADPKTFSYRLEACNK